jgi:hypothetical protein
MIKNHFIEYIEKNKLKTLFNINNGINFLFNKTLQRNSSQHFNSFLRYFLVTHTVYINKLH